MKSAGVGFFDFIERVKPSREAIVLTDFDLEGKQLSLQLLKELTSNRIKADDCFRKQFGALCRSEVRSVEELADYMERLRQIVVA
jgi:5S rRNA maturation endonuclease (ribonuclease M5)